MTNPLRKLGPVCTRMMKLARFDRLTIPVSSGSEPELVIDEDDTELYRDCDHDDFGDVIEFCPRAPAGQCEYDWRDNFKACIHCGNKSGLDE